MSDVRRQKHGRTVLQGFGQWVRALMDLAEGWVLFKVSQR